VHESSDISLRGLLAGLGVILTGIAASLGGAWLIASVVASPAAGPTRAERPHMAAPSLETVPHQDLQGYLREKHERLHGSGPIEGEPGRVHIPIERAMRLLAEGKAR
jgi:hypothetical protein